VAGDDLYRHTNPEFPIQNPFAYGQSSDNVHDLPNTEQIQPGNG